MKKGTTKAQAQEKKTERSTLQYLDVAAALASERTAGKDGNIHVFDLVAPFEGRETVTLSIFLSDKDYDLARLDIFGFTITGYIRSGKNGMFFSFPETKMKNGDYFSHAACFDKNFHALMKDFLAAYYA